MAEIGKRELEHLAELARIELHEKEKEKLIVDLGNILKHFEELKALNTDGVEPLTGGTSEKNVLREDADLGRPFGVEPGKLIEAFPDREGDYLKVPPVFE
ncbi:MAG: Asp-tRNA(Asn)/Glu-tRNA(Gln) amidotransferase subunit GatC [Patescibacteria group bacterium]